MEDPPENAAFTEDTSYLVQQLAGLEEALGSTAFVSLNLVIAIALSIWLIPWATDLMVNSAAGLTSKYLGKRWRTLVINGSTNNPEAGTMLVSLLVLGKTGGIATPLGSNFANIYLIYVVALAYVLIRSCFSRKGQFAKIVGVVRKERNLMYWHIVLAVFLFFAATGAYYLLTGQLPIDIGNTGSESYHPGAKKLLLAFLICAAAIASYLFLDNRLQRRRPELYEEIDDSSHTVSWGQFVVGTLGLIVACYIINAMFDAANHLYSENLKPIFGESVFAALHYFMGALVTSLPEMHVAIKNYQRATSPDFNTALASASASNMCNLAIAGLGIFAAALFLA